MSKTIIFDTEATDIKEHVLIESAWVELCEINLNTLPPLLKVTVSTQTAKLLEHLRRSTSN